MQRKQSGAQQSLQSLVETMNRWRSSAMCLHRLSRLQMESLLVGDSRQFGAVLWQKQSAQRDFRRLAGQAKALRQRANARNLQAANAEELGERLAAIRQAEQDIAGLLREAAEFEIRSEQILRLRMRGARAA